MKLHLGCGRTQLDGYVNVDSVTGPTVDVVADLDNCPDFPKAGGLLLMGNGRGGRQKLPFEDNSVDEIIGVHFLEHITRPLQLMQELWRVAQPGCKMQMTVPYGSSDDASEDPTHARLYFLNSWGYFSQPYYWRANYGYTADWINGMVQLDFLEHWDGVDQKTLYEAVLAQRNVVYQMTAELHAVKPARPQQAELRTQPKVAFNIMVD